MKVLALRYYIILYYIIVIYRTCSRLERTRSRSRWGGGEGSTKHGVKKLAAAESVRGDELKDEWKASPTREPWSRRPSKTKFKGCIKTHLQQSWSRGADGNDFAFTANIFPTSSSYFSSTRQAVGSQIRRRTLLELACTKEPSCITRRGKWLAWTISTTTFAALRASMITPATSWDIAGIGFLPGLRISYRCRTLVPFTMISKFICYKCFIFPCAGVLQLLSSRPPMSICQKKIGDPLGKSLHHYVPQSFGEDQAEIWAASLLS